jgi:hypothetical protein
MRLKRTSEERSDRSWSSEILSLETGLPITPPLWTRTGTRTKKARKYLYTLKWDAPGLLESVYF